MKSIPRSIRDGERVFKDMCDVVHIDEAWFCLKPEAQTFWIGREERCPIRKTRHKKHVVKVMFMCAVACPPVAVFIHQGCGVQCVASILLTVLGWVPGIVHALWVIRTKEEDIGKPEDGPTAPATSLSRYLSINQD